MNAQVQPAPLLFEAATPEVRTETIEAVLTGLERREREFLAKNPSDLGRRCESVLAGQLPEWLTAHGFLSNDDLQRLGELVVVALPKRLQLRAV